MSNELIVPDVDERTRNQIVSRLGRRKLRQIADEVGVSLDVVLQVKNDVADSMDALTVDEHVAKAFVELQEIVAMAKDEFNSTEDLRSKAPLLSAAITATKTTLQMLEKWNDKHQNKVETLNAKRQSEIVKALNRMSELTADALDDGQPHSRDEILKAMLDGLMTAAVEMEGRNGPDVA